MAANSSDITPVLVVGAGPTGLTMACELARYGINLRLIDKSAHAAEQSRALAVHARTLELFQDMGCVEPFLNAGLKLTSISAFSEGKRFVHFRLDELDSAYPFSISIPQTDTEKLLAEHLKSFGKSPERSCELVGLKQEKDHVVATVQKADGTKEEIKAQWVVGCDGARSAVRKLQDIPFKGSQEEEIFLIADVKVDWVDEEPDRLSAHDHPDGITAIFAMPEQRYRIICVVDPQSVWKDRKEPTLEEIREMVKKRVPLIKDVSDPRWLTSFQVRYKQVPEYRYGRTFLCGDAAHIHSPMGGQGMNTGIQDAYNLAWKLALVQQGLAKDILLDSYQAERHAIAEALLKTTEFVTKVNITRNPLTRELRNRIAPFLSAQEIVQQRARGFISELEINYKRSPIVSEHRRSLVKVSTFGSGEADMPTLGQWLEFGSGPKPGERAPDAVLTSPTKREPIRLYDLLVGTQHDLLVLTGDDAEGDVFKELIEFGNKAASAFSKVLKVHMIAPTENAPAAMEKWTGDLYLDPEFSLHHKYGAGSECAYLIRPDGYIGFRCQPVDFAALKSYFDQYLV